MKLLPSHTPLRPTFWWLPALGSIIVLFFTQYIPFCFHAHQVLLLAAVLIMFTPLGNQSSTQNSTRPKRFHFLQSLSLTLLLQLMLACLFYTLCHLCSVSLPILSPTSIPLFQVSTNALLLSWGVFPWGAYVLMAVALARTVYIKKQPGNISTLIRPLLKNNAGDALSLIGETATKIMMTLALVSTLSFICLELVSFIARFFNLSLATGLRIDVIIAMLVIITWNQAHNWARYTRWLSKRNITPAMIVSLLLVFTTVTFITISYLIGWLSPLFTPLLTKSTHYLSPVWFTIWGVFLGVWWLSWTPLIAGALAYVWQGYKIRTMIFYSLLAPASLTFWWLQHTNKYSDLGTHISMSHNPLNLVPVFIGLFLLLKFFLRPNTIGYADKALLPLTLRRRISQIFLSRLIQGTIVFILVYWMGGVYALTMAYFITAYVGILFVLAAGVGMFRVRGSVQTQDVASTSL